MKDKIMNFRCIASLITINEEEVSWVVGDPRVNSQRISKNTLKFNAKAWWTTAQHRLCPINRDDVLSLVRTALIVGFMEGYKFEVAQFIAREI